MHHPFFEKLQEKSTFNSVNLVGHCDGLGFSLSI